MKKTIIAVFVIGFILLRNPQVLVADKPSVKEYITMIFGAKANIATAVLIHESNLKVNAINYNCRYGGKSTFCKHKDIAKAISVDCGIGQINVKGKVCPANLLTIEGNMDAIQKIYNTQGLRAWVSYNSKAYKKYLVS